MTLDLARFSKICIHCMIFIVIHQVLFIFMLNIDLVVWTRSRNEKKCTCICLSTRGVAIVGKRVNYRKSGKVSEIVVQRQRLNYGPPPDRAQCSIIEQFRNLCEPAGRNSGPECHSVCHSLQSQSVCLCSMCTRSHSSVSLRECQYFGYWTRYHFCTHTHI